MDTVLGLSLTETAVGWVLVAGRDADGTIVDHDQFDVSTGTGALAAHTSEELAEVVLQAQTAATEREQRLHLVGVTWSDAAAAEAALLLEKLTQRGLSNVVPIRWLDSAELLARGVAPVVGYERAAVCVLEHDSTTVVMVDDSDGDARTAVKHLQGDADRLTQWLTTMFDRSAWKPDGVVVVADHALDALSWQLEQALPVPVFTQSGVPLAMARGAALAAAQSPEFTEAPPVERAGSGGARSGSPSLAGGLGMLAAGAMTLVASVSLAVSPRLLPDKPAQPVQHVVHKPAPTPMAKAPAPPPAKVEAPPRQAAPEPEPAEEEPTVAAAVEPQSGIAPEPPADLPGAEPPPAPPPPAAPPPAEPNPHPLLTKILERLHGQPDDAAPNEPPAQGPPPNPTVP